MSDLELNKKSASEIIQIDTIVPKTPKIHRDTNLETKKAAVQLNIVEVDENVTSEPCCTPTTGPIPCQIFKWIWKIIKWIANLFFLLMSWFVLVFFVFMSLFIAVWLFWAVGDVFVQTYIATSLLICLPTACMWLGVVVFLLKGAPWRKMLMESLRLLKC